ncbi:MAG: hypothetical protein WC233_03840 [Sphaerochaeta sp.]
MAGTSVSATNIEKPVGRAEVQRILMILLLSVGSVMVSYTTRRLLPRLALEHEKSLCILSKRLKILAMFFIEPFSMFSSIWSFSFDEMSVASFPLIGILLMLLVASSILFITKILRFEPNQAASMFTSGAFSNILTFGGLTAFLLFGIEGYTLIILLNLFIVPVTYFVGYPVSRQIGLGQPLKEGFSRQALANAPFLVIPFVAFIAGGICNFVKIDQPQLMISLRSILIPSNTVLLGISIGLTLRFEAIGRYWKEIGWIFFVKFIISPTIMMIISLLFGLRHVMGGLPFKVAIIASVMPVGFNALIPPALYGFDLDLANSAWIASMFAFIMILPAAYLILM